MWNLHWGMDLVMYSCSLDQRSLETDYNNERNMIERKTQQIAITIPMQHPSEVRAHGGMVADAMLMTPVTIGKLASIRNYKVEKCRRPGSEPTHFSKIQLYYNVENAPEDQPISLKQPSSFREGARGKISYPVDV
jgi:hypothetical protein